MFFNQKIAKLRPVKENSRNATLLHCNTHNSPTFVININTNTEIVVIKIKYASQELIWHLTNCTLFKII